MSVALAILTAVMFGSTTVAIRLGFRRPVAENMAALSPLIVSTALAVPAGLVSLPFTGGHDLRGLWRFALAGLVAPGASQLFFMPAVRYAGAARVGILIGMAPVFSAGLAILALGEPLRAVLVVATGLIVVGGALLAWDPSRPEGFRRIGLLFGAVAALLFAGQAVMLRWASTGRSIPPLAALAVMVATGAAVPLLVLGLSRGRAAFAGARPALKAFWPAGVLFTAASLGFVLAYKYGRVVIVAPLTATESMWTIVFAALLIGINRDAITRRVLGACVLIVIGGVLVGVAA